MPELFETLMYAAHRELVITTPYEGGHPDHDAAAFITAAALETLDHASRHIEMTSYHLGSNGFRCGAFCGPACGEPLVRALDDDARTRKRAMFDAYESQRAMLSQFPIETECLRIAPRYDFTQPPNDGAIWYESLGWPQRAGAFCAAAARAREELACTS